MKSHLLFISIMLGMLTTLTTKPVWAANDATDKMHGMDQIQVTELDLYDPTRQRPVKITLWYPAQPPCQQARICLAPRTILNKALVFSHGAMGAAKGYSWIGKMFAAQGYVTVGVNHYGESWVYGPEHVNPAAALQFWERPLDISFVLDVLQKNQLPGSVLAAPQVHKSVANPSTLSDAVPDTASIFDKNIDWSQIVAIGHSSGGATLLNMAGSKLDFNHAASYCTTAAAAPDRSCHYLKFQTAANTRGYDPTRNFYDARIQSVIALDPALGHATTAQSLQAMRIPVLVIGSSQNDFLPYTRHAGYYAANIPAATSLVFAAGEGHFVYLDRCTHQHQAMGVALCVDRPGIDRTQVHHKAGKAMLKFVQQTPAG